MHVNAKEDMDDIFFFEEFLSFSTRSTFGIIFQASTLKKNMLGSQGIKSF
jgi:hypothetical protein